MEGYTYMKNYKENQVGINCCNYDFWIAFENVSKRLGFTKMTLEYF